MHGLAFDVVGSRLELGDKGTVVGELFWSVSWETRAAYRIAR